MSPFEARLLAALEEARKRQNVKGEFTAWDLGTGDGPNTRAYYGARQGGKSFQQSTLRACDIFIAPRRAGQPGWICSHCHFANDNAIAHCEDCRKPK